MNREQIPIYTSDEMNEVIIKALLLGGLITAGLMAIGIWALS